MNMILLAPMRQPNEHGSVGMTGNSTCTWNSVWTLESTSPASCSTPATSNDFIHPNNQPGGSRESKKWSTPNISYCTALAYVNRIAMESSPNRDSDYINILTQGKTPQQKASRIVQPRFTYKNSVLWKVDFELVLRTDYGPCSSAYQN